MSKTITRTTEGLREMLLDELEDYINGLNTTERMDTVSKTAAVVCKTLIVDLEAKKMLQRINIGRDKPKQIADLNLNLSLEHVDHAD